MTGRNPGLGYGGLIIDFSSDNKCAQNHIETHSGFNQLIFNGFIGLVLEILSSYNDFSENFNFHNNSMSYSTD